jgi:hypothetical protein
LGIKAQSTKEPRCRWIVGDVRVAPWRAMKCKSNAGGEGKPHQAPRVFPSPPATPTPLPFPLNHPSQPAMSDLPPNSHDDAASRIAAASACDEFPPYRRPDSGEHADSSIPPRRSDMRGCEGRLRGSRRVVEGVRGRRRELLGALWGSGRLPCIAFAFAFDRAPNTPWTSNARARSRFHLHFRPTPVPRDRLYGNDGFTAAFSFYFGPSFP